MSTMTSRITAFFVTKNRGKFREAYRILSKYNINLKQLPEEKLEIQSDSLEDVVLYSIKELVKKHPKKILVVEDAGLFIEALNGFPGPFSSYVYKTIGLKGILKLLEDKPTRRAYFKSVVAFHAPGMGPRIFTGLVYGYISYEIRGSGGFGYDPIFIPEGSDRTFAEMSTEEKNAFSHRGKAFKAFAEWFVQSFSSRA